MSTTRELDDEYLTVAAAARQIGVARSAVYRWAAVGKLRARTLGGRIVLYREDITCLAAERRSADAAS